MAIQPALMSIEEYLSTSYSPDVDFVDGMLEERNLGEYDHGRLQGIVFSHFHVRRKALGLYPVIEQRILVSPARVRICDIALIDHSKAKERVSRTPPAACVEILSPEDRLSRAQVVLSDYLDMGVPNIWLIDPIRCIAYTFDHSGLHLHEGSLRLVDTDTRVDLDQLFAEIDD